MNKSYIVLCTAKCQITTVATSNVKPFTGYFVRAQAFGRVWSDGKHLGSIGCFEKVVTMEVPRDLCTYMLRQLSVQSGSVTRSIGSSTRRVMMMEFDGGGVADVGAKITVLGGDGATESQCFQDRESITHDL